MKIRPLLTSPDWMERGLCTQTDPDLFHPDLGGSSTPAKKVCLGCPVKDTCLDYALTNDERLGVWGGTSPADRRRLRKSLNETRAA